MKFINDVKLRIKELNRGIAIAEKILSKEVKGSLRVEMRGQSFRYRKTERNSDNIIVSNRYLNRREISEVKKLAEKEYAEIFLEKAKSEVYLLTRLQKLYGQQHAYNSHEMLHPARRAMTTPILMSDREYAKIWFERRSSIKNTYPIDSEIYTNNGEQVRSKSEKLIADLLFQNGIPYKYEECLNISDIKVFPDFTILKISSREIMYWEHFGRIDYDDYREKMMKKIEFYSKNGIVLGKNLIVTFETKDHPLSVLMIEKIVEELAR